MPLDHIDEFQMDLNDCKQPQVGRSIDLYRTEILSMLISDNGLITSEHIKIYHTRNIYQEKSNDDGVCINVTLEFELICIRVYGLI